MSETTQGAGFATLAIHAGAQPVLAAHTIFGPQPGSAGSSLDCAMLEERVAVLEGGTAAVAVASGAAARTLVLHTLLLPGDELVAVGAADTSETGPVDASLRRFGWTIRRAEPDRPEHLVEALSDRTKAILVESIASSGAIADIEAVAAIARRARVPLVVDNTLATPWLVRPFEHGADIVLHTGTALLAGHAGAAAGLVVDGGTFSFAGDARYPALSQPMADGSVLAETYGNFAFAMAARLALRAFGGAPAPLDAFLVASGIETLALRLARQCASADAVARHLVRHQSAMQVRYAGLEGDACHALARHYCPRGAGIVLSFKVADGDSATMLARHLRVFAPADEIGGTRSRLLLSAGDVVRVMIGLEDAADIIADLDRALARASN